MTPVLTLDVDGIIDDPALMANQVFANYLQSYFSQSTLYFGTVLAYKHHHSTCGMNPSEMVNAVQSALTDLYKPHFAQVNIKVRHTKDKVNPAYDIIISGQLSTGDTIYDLAKEIKVSDAMFSEYEGEE